PPALRPHARRPAPAVGLARAPVGSESLWPLAVRRDVAVRQRGHRLLGPTDARRNALRDRRDHARPPALPLPPPPTRSSSVIRPILCHGLDAWCLRNERHPHPLPPDGRREASGRAAPWLDRKRRLLDSAGARARG